MPIMHEHKTLFNKLPHSVAYGGGYSSQHNVTEGRAMGIKRVVFYKRIGISYQALGVKEKNLKNCVILERVLKGIF